MDLQKSHLHKRLERLDEEDNDDSMREKEEKRKREAEVVNCLVQPFIITADEALRDNRQDPLPVCMKPILPVFTCT